jgi:hypothetical protein
MAMNLKTKKKCHIVPPDWLSVGAPQRLYHFIDNMLTRVEQTFFRKDWQMKQAAQSSVGSRSALPR